MTSVWTGVILDNMEDSLLTKEDIILLFLEGPAKLAKEIFYNNVPKSDEMRALICELGNSRCAYCYAKYVDKKPTDKTRTISCKTAVYAHCYAEYIDGNTTDETRECAGKDPYWRMEYEAWENSLKKI